MDHRTREPRPGRPGTGKSHLLVALGTAAAQTGYKVRYLTAADLAETLYRGLADNSVGKIIDTLLRNDLIIIEVGFSAGRRRLLGDYLDEPGFIRCLGGDGEAGLGWAGGTLPQDRHAHMPVRAGKAVGAPSVTYHRLIPVTSG